MTTERPTNAMLDPAIQPYVDFWSDYIKQADDTTRDLWEDIQDNAEVKSLQRRWSDAISKSIDAYMRSPLFLDVMKQNADSMIKAKLQIDGLASEFARNANIPTATDISGLFERLHSIEEAILGRLGNIEKRLTTIEARFGTGQPPAG